LEFPNSREKEKERVINMDKLIIRTGDKRKDIMCLIRDEKTIVVFEPRKNMI